jgi:hypothetical protein
MLRSQPDPPASRRASVRPARGRGVRDPSPRSVPADCRRSRRRASAHRSNARARQWGICPSATAGVLLQGLGQLARAAEDFAKARQLNPNITEWLEETPEK